MTGKANGSDKREPETIDGATGLPDPTPDQTGAFGKDGRRIDLSNLRDIRIELAKLYRRMDSGDVTATEGSRRAFVLRQIHDVIVSAELERRITELEERRSLPAPIEPDSMTRTH
jgi:hypothetical protein